MLSRLDVFRLRPNRTLDYVETHALALFQCTEGEYADAPKADIYVWRVRTANEAVTQCIVEPF